MRISLVIEHEGSEVKITPSDDQGGAGQGDGGTVAGLNFERLARVAACVVSCLASTARHEANEVAAAAGGQHQSPPTKK